MRWLTLAVLLFAGSPAAAQQYGEPPSVVVRRAGEADVARASMDVHAPPAAVWDLIADCDHARRLMQELLSCRVLEQGEGWEVREHRVRGWLLRPVLRNVARVEFEPNRRLSFRRVAGDWSRSDGEWVLTPIDGGRGTHVQYTLRAAFEGPLPDSFTRSLIRKRVRSTLTALRREAESAG
jgi:uncharacterized protein YndB with AHSA1/START domain